MQAFGAGGSTVWVLLVDSAAFDLYGHELIYENTNEKEMLETTQGFCN
jgi:hypothetical protein